MKKVILLSLIASSTVVFANINVKSLDIYKNRTFVNQELDIAGNSVDLLGKVRFEDIRFIVDGECKVGDTFVILNNKSLDSLSLDIKKQKEEIAFLSNEIKSTKNYIDSLEDIGFEKKSVNLQNIKDVTSYVKKEVYENYNLLYKLNMELKKYNQDLSKLILKKKSDLFTKLNYNTTCLSDSKIYVNYPVYNISKSNFYEINANSNKDNIEIKNSAFITQSSGYDFSNIDINLYTYNYSNQINPRYFTPKYLDVYSPPVAYMQEDSMMMEISASKSAKSVSRLKKSEPKYRYKESSTKSFFNASGIDLRSGVKTPVLFANDSYTTSSKIEIDGYAASKPFYKVEFKSNKLYSTLNTKLYLDSVYIGQSYQKEIKKDKKSAIYFSEDRFIDVKKELITDMKEKPFFSISKLKTEKLWKYTITNNHKSKKTITLVERLPISKHEDIKVKLISKTKYTSKDDNGKISYDFEINPNEKKVIEFGYTVEKPYKK